jgi:cytochrome oxidase Cu insertion factor (SCO1/SenC/PrrC family)
MDDEEEYWARQGSPKLRIVKNSASVKFVTHVRRWEPTRIRIFRMKVKDKAPEFSLPDENGNTVELKQFRGKPVVLFFYPKADTPG